MAPHDSSSSDLSTRMVLDDEHSYSLSCEPRKSTSCVCFHASELLLPLKSSSKSVTFMMDALKVLEIIHLDDYTPEEFQSCWYSAQEYEAIQAQCLAEASTLCYKDLDNRPILRGLECFVQEIAHASLKARKETIWAVIEEQRLQREEGSVDPEFISEIYEQQSLLSRVQACITGVNDRLAALH